MRGCHIHNFLFAAVVTLTVIMANSCLKDLPETTPSRLEWDPEIAFPLGEESFGMNDILGFDTSLLDLDTVTNIPRWVEEYALEIIMEGSIDFDLSSLNENPDQINSILMRFNIYNGYPDELHAQAYFLDQGGLRIDSMSDKGPVRVSGGKLVGNGEIIDPTHVREDAIFDSERLGRLEDAANILFRATIPLPGLNPALIPYYPYYHIDVQTGVMLDLSIEFD